MKMVEVGDKVKIKAVRHGGDLAQVNDVVTVTGPIMARGFIAITEDGEEVYVCYDFDDSCADCLAGPIVANETQTESERRGAKFGVKGVVRQTGVSVRFISDKNHKNGLGEALWTVVNEDEDVYPIHPANIRLDHEPEFVAWSEAPEHLRYDASRVYYDGEPVQWIAKPEGAFTDVVVVQENGIMRFSTHNLTVKL